MQKLGILDLRIPNWDQAILQDRSCPICDAVASAVEYERPDGLHVRRCHDCSTLYVSPAPSPDALAKFYETYHAVHFCVTGESEAWTLKSLRATDPFIDPRIQVAASHMNLKDSLVLDVGCGKGQFLYQLKKLGADVVGLEVDPDAVSFAHKLGIQSIHRGTIETFADERKFDLVVLNDLIEHPLKPVEVLRAALGLLKDSGLLLIWTPNGDRVECDLERMTLRVDLEHMQYLGSAAFLHLTRILPIKIIHYETLGYPNLGPIPTNIPFSSTKRRAKRFAKKMPGFSLVNHLRQKFGLNNSARLGNYHLFCILGKTDQAISTAVSQN